MPFNIQYGAAGDLMQLAQAAGVAQAQRFNDLHAPAFRSMVEPDAQEGQINDGNRLQAAQMLSLMRQQRAPGQSTTSESQFSQRGSPLQRAIAQAKTAPPQHDWDGTQPQGGTISFSPGTGPNAMSPEAFDAGMNRVADNLGTGEHTTGTPQNPGVFVPNQQASTDPIVKMVQTFKAQGMPDAGVQELQALADAGASPQQIASRGQQILGAQATADNRQQTRQASASRQQDSQRMQQSRMQIQARQRQITQLQSQMKDIEKNYPGIADEGAEEIKRDTPDMQQAYQRWSQLKQNLDSRQREIGQLSDSSGGKSLDPQTAQQIYQQAGGDPAKARAMAQQMGFTF